MSSELLKSTELERPVENDSARLTVPAAAKERLMVEYRSELPMEVVKMSSKLVQRDTRGCCSSLGGVSS